MAVTTAPVGGRTVIDATDRDDGDLGVRIAFKACAAGKDDDGGESCDMTASSLPTDSRFLRCTTDGSLGATIGVFVCGLVLGLLLATYLVPSR